MRSSQVTERYARSLFELALEKKALEVVYNDILLLQKVCRENKNFRQFLKNPVIHTDKKEKIIRELFGPSFQDLTLTFLLIVIRKNREEMIPEIADQFIEQYLEYSNILRVRFTTAAPATDAVRKEVLEIMKAYSNKNVRLDEEIDPEVIGGFTLTWKDLQYDASVRRQIARLKRGVATINLYVKEF